MRLFIAINFNESTKSRLLGLRDELKSASASGDFSLPENLHLTLVFLGECSETQASVIKSVMDAVSFEPFDILIDHIGRFKREDGGIWWAGAHENKTLSALHADLTDKLIDAGFELEKRRYSPHITLGRRIVTNGKPQAIEAFGETAHTVDLMKSERIGGRLTYTAIHSANGKM